MVINCNLI